MFYHHAIWRGESVVYSILNGEKLTYLGNTQGRKATLNHSKDGLFVLLVGGRRVAKKSEAGKRA